DLDGFCNQGSGSAKVAGAIKSETNDNIKGVTVTLSGEANKTVTTAADGVYNFSVDKGMDVTITPSKDDNPLAGISTFDLVKISKHILRVELLDSPYKMIAADVNNSKTISALDLVELRKLILFVNNDFSNNSSWRFVKKDYVFPQVSNPWAAEFPEVASVNNVAADQLAADFVAIKIGDVTGEAYRNAATGVENRSAGEFVLNVADQNVVAGREYTVTFNAAEVANIEGYQFSMNLKGLELVEVVEGVATAENFGLALVDEGVITTSWNGTADSEELFSLVFKATANGKLSEMVQVTSQLTAAEAYNANEEVLNVALRFNGQEVANGFELFQNVPNPFNGKTVIGFNLPENGSATLRVYDVAGKVLKVVRGDYAKGYNQVELESSQLPATGVLYYTLETNMGTA
ncbi:MAG TPA: T9SS type A sorting domain-containing protein, partial [Candidatus Saccharibacteria bacterium]|nr:T9SS type A sorting domain-containing protein [Candidatus Saccharibacteria bacterium]